MKFLISALVVGTVFCCGCQSQDSRLAKSAITADYVTDLRVEEVRPEPSLGMTMVVAASKEGVQFQGIARPDETFVVGERVKVSRVVQLSNKTTQVKFLVFSHQ